MIGHIPEQFTLPIGIRFGAEMDRRVGCGRFRAVGRSVCWTAGRSVAGSGIAVRVSPARGRR